MGLEGPNKVPNIEAGEMVVERDSKKESEKILTENLSSLANMFEMEDKNGAHSELQPYAENIIAIIQRYTEYPVERGQRKLKTPYEFLKSIRNAQEEALKKNDGDEETQKKIRELFSHVDMPGLAV